MDDDTSIKHVLLHFSLLQTVVYDIVIIYSTFSRVYLSVNIIYSQKP